MKMRKVKLGKDGWPIEMPMPKADHFVYGCRLTWDGCGCLAGWIEYVFSGGKNPDKIKLDATGDAAKNTPARQFGRAVAFHLGLDSCWDEDSFDHAMVTGEISRQDCATAWREAARDFGYTETVR